MKIILFLAFVAADARANFWTGTIDLTQEYSCLGIDGVPIGNNSPLASQCCSDGQLIANAPAQCRAGFNSITADAGSGAAGGINIAQNTLQLEQGMHGITVQTPKPEKKDVITPAIPQSESQAIAAGGNASDENEAMAEDEDGKSASALTSGGGRGGAGSGGGLAMGIAGGTSAALTKGDGDPNAQKPSGGGYVKGGDGAGGKGSGGGLYGMVGSGAGGVGAGGANELAFGTGADGDAGANGAGASGEDGDGNGSPDDPSDYFSRIDKSANIFKIVSARYMKKKSLWVPPQKLSEDLKQKSI